ncbi:MAG: glycosyltransferase family 8 protein [Alphaproteobacteria bacterium]|nr:glycosyltransferase family 8 protein [Alphaproteobacteria bacterium]
MVKKYINYIYILVAILVLFAGVFFYIYGKKAINIAYMVDNNYVPYMITSMHSAIKNKNKESVYNFYIIAENFSSENIEKIKKIKENNVNIEIIPARQKTLDYSHLGRFASFKIAMQKIFIPDYLEDVDKVLYLDADTLIQKDLNKIYSTNMGDAYIGATKDGLMYQFPEHITEIGLDWRKFYFNSGVMLLNLKDMRKDAIIEKSITYFNTHYEVFGDQDILNVVVNDKVIPISYRYNCNSTFFEEKDAEFLSNFYNEKVYQTSRENYDNAVILHFAGHKPWTEWYTHSYLKPLWYEYYKEASSKYNI